MIHINRWSTTQREEHETEEKSRKKENMFLARGEEDPCVNEFDIVLLISIPFFL
jgi:hypothetical protein